MSKIMKGYKIFAFTPSGKTLKQTLTCTHRWNRLVFTQCYSSTGQDWRHNSDRFRVSRGQILEAILLLNSVLWRVSHTLINTVCESKYARSPLAYKTYRDNDIQLYHSKSGELYIVIIISGSGKYSQRFLIEAKWERWVCAWKDVILVGCLTGQ